MKRFFTILLATVMMLSLVACGEHECVWMVSVGREATCLVEGIEIKVCDKCGKEKKFIIPKQEHKYVMISTTQTCTQNGKKTYECSKCKDVYEEEVTAMGHTWFEATCLKEKYCTVCNVTDGGKGEHEFVGKTCILCGLANTKNITCNGVKFTVPISVIVTSFSDRKIKIIDITVTEKTSDSYSIGYSAECLNGDGDGIGFKYSLYDMEGYVVASGTEFTKDLKTGEKTRNESFQLYFSSETDGLINGQTYRLEISNDSY